MLITSIMGNLKNFEPKKRQLSPGEAQSVLKEEIEQLKKELESQTVVRSALEKALNCQPLLDDPILQRISSKKLLFWSWKSYIWRSIFYQCIEEISKRLSTLPRVDEKPETNDEIHSRISSEVAKTNLEPLNEEDSVITIHRCLSNQLVPSECRLHSAVAEGVDAYHSLPLSMLEDSTSNANQAECNTSSFPGRVCETLNWLSEEMIKCISAVYCHLSDPPLSEHHNIYGLSSEENPSFGSWLNNPFHLEASNEFSGSLFTMVEIHGLFRDSQRLNDVEDLLQNYRCLISKLAQVDPGKLRHEEKLAFWINIHNALVMHAFMVYGVPRGNLKRISLVLKAAYNIGGHTISVDTIQSSILGCRLPRPTPKKFKAGDPRKAFAVKHSEPQLHFALCSGCQSDPAVRLYTPKRVFQELEMAKEDHIQMNIKLHKEQRLLVPKNVEYFIKEMGLSTSGIAEMIDHSMPHSLANNFQQPQHGKLWKKIDWIPHNFTFRFLLSNELVR
ncbi:hypothetical protein DH2020_006743 [Rehmannia glutinosa]|uniref:DUF547 domain-containing protein n=1 Tax=Rehmannia glutinosa TaxID=99300 RepID=A0ABR0XK23_REHGL